MWKCPIHTIRFVQASTLASTPTYVKTGMMPPIGERELAVIQPPKTIIRRLMIAVQRAPFNPLASSVSKWGSAVSRATAVTSTLENPAFFMKACSALSLNPSHTSA